MIIPGLVSVTFREQTADWVIGRCRKAGLLAVEWSENIHVFPGDVTGAAELSEKTAAAGLEIAAYGSYYQLGEYQQPEAVFHESLAAAAALKAPIIRIWAGTKPSAEVDDEVFHRMAEEAALLSETARGCGIKVALEWHRNTLTDTNESGIRLLTEAGHPNLYTLWQPTPELDMKARMDGIDQLGDRILNLHIYYWRGREKRPLWEGLAEWEKYLAHVNDNSRRYGLLEFVMEGSEAQFFEDAAVLRDMLRDSSFL